MKKITFPVVLFLLAACSSNNESRQTEETVATVVTVDETVPDTVQVDAVTSATSKPNQVSFNGTMVIPPQRMATVSLTMGGVVKSTSLLPGEDGGIRPYLQVKAPIAGYVADVEMNVGKYMNAGDALCEIVDKRYTLLRLTAYEKDLADMKIGSSVQFRVNGMGKTVFKATLISIGQKVDEDTRSVEVYARVDTVNSQFRPGMYVTARIMK